MTRQKNQAPTESPAPNISPSTAGPLMIWSTLPDGTPDYCNQAWFDYTGWNFTVPPDTEFQKKIIHADDNLSTRTAWEKSLSSGSPYRAEYRMRHKSGQYRWVLAEALPILNESGEIQRWLGTTIDIEDQKRNEEKIRIEQKKWQEIFQNARWGIALTDRQGRFVEINPAYAEMHGMEISELRGQSAINLLAKESQELYPAWFQQLQETGRLVIESIHLRKDGSRFPVLTEASLIRDDRAEPIFHVLTHVDLTSTRKAEEERNRLMAREQAALEASKMKSGFMATVSHEIRTPLHAVLGLVELLKGTNLQPNQKEYVEAVHQASENLLAIVNDILDVSKIEAGKMELEISDFSLREMLHEIERIFRPLISQKGLNFEIIAGPELPEKARGDSRRILQILNNILNNAVKFTSEGKITFSIQKLQTPPSLCFEIRDTGRGISPENLKKIFSPFTQEDASMSRQFGGTGLGLTIARELATSMQGEIKVDSISGKGSIFTITLPFLAAGQEPKKPESRGAEQNLTGLRVLIGEDNPINQKILVSILKQFGAQASISSQSEGLKGCFNLTGVDLVLVNCRTLFLDATDLMKFLSQAQTQKVPVIAICDGNLLQERARCEQFGISEVLLLPADPQDLMNAAIRMTRNQSSMKNS